LTIRCSGSVKLYLEPCIKHDDVVFHDIELIITTFMVVIIVPLTLICLGDTEHGFW